MKTITEQSVYKIIYNGYSFTLIYYSDDQAGKAGILPCFSMTGFLVF
jgi:hypothetical protein